MSQIAESEALFLSPSEWRDLSSRLGDPFFQSLAESNRQALARLATYDDPAEVPQELDEPDGLKLQFPARLLRNLLCRSMVEWRLTGDPTAARTFRDTADRLVSLDLSVIHPETGLRYADLHLAEAAFAVAFVLDAGIEASSESTLSALKNRACEEILPRFLAAIEADEWWIDCTFNWSASLNGSCGLLALAIRDHAPELSERVLSAADRGLRILFSGFKAGGGWPEGPMYLATTVGHLTDYVRARVRIGLDDLGLAENRRWHELFDYRMHALAPDGRLFNFSNCNDGTREWLLPHAYFWAERCDRPDWTTFEDQNPRGSSNCQGVFFDVEAFWYRPPHPMVGSPKTKRLFHASELGWAHWRGERSWVGVRGGHNGDNHNNLDLGTVIFGSDRVRWIADPGYGARETIQHSTPTIFRQGQALGATAPLTVLLDEHEAFACSLDLSAAFPHTVARFVRYVIADDQVGLWLLDDILGANRRRCGARFHVQTRANVEVDEDALRLTQDDDVAWLTPVSEVESMPAEIVEWEWDRRPISSVSWRELPDRRHVVHATSLSVARDRPVTAMEVRGNVVRLVLDDSTYSVDLDRRWAERER